MTNRRANSNQMMRWCNGSNSWINVSLRGNDPFDFLTFPTKKLKTVHHVNNLFVLIG